MNGLLNAALFILSNCNRHYRLKFVKDGIAKCPNEKDTAMAEQIKIKINYTQLLKGVHGLLFDTYFIFFLSSYWSIFLYFNSHTDTEQFQLFVFLFMVWITKNKFSYLREQYTNTY